jgi:hypothetical protein
MFGLDSKRAEREAEAERRKEAAMASRERGLATAAPGYSWTMIASFDEPVMEKPTCDTCGAQVPVRNQLKHTSWHELLGS